MKDELELVIHKIKQPVLIKNTITGKTTELPLNTELLNKVQQILDDERKREV